VSRGGTANCSSTQRATDRSATSSPAWSSNNLLYYAKTMSDSFEKLEHAGDPAGLLEPVAKHDRGVAQEGTQEWVGQRPVQLRFGRYRACGAIEQSQAGSVGCH
jgi:hypothetical protein